MTHKLLTGEQTVSHELTGTHGARPLSHGYGNAGSWYSSGIDERQEAEQKEERKVERKCYTKRTAQKGHSTAENCRWPNPNSRNPKKGDSRGSPLLPPAISYVLRSEPHFSAQGT